MRRYLKRRIAGVLLPAVLIVMSGTGVMAEPITTVDLGTFYAVAENRDPGGGRDPGNNDPGIEHPKNEDPESGSSSGNRPGAGENESNVSGDMIAQAPATGDLITEKRTVVATKTKWRISPSFNVARVSSSDKRAIKASKKKDKSRSSKGNKWYCGYLAVKKPGTVTITLEGSNGEKEEYLIYAEDPKIKKNALVINDVKARSSKGNKWYCGFIKVKKPGTVTITLEGSAGEKEEYLIYAEDPKIKKNALVVNDVKTISMDNYLSGVKYLKPTSVDSKTSSVATVSADGSITVRADGKSKLILCFGKRKVKGNVKAKLPVFKKKKVTVKDKPVKLQMKNVSNNSAVRYSSSDISVVKMNKDGYAAPVANGTATVFGKSGNVTAECEVTVKGLK